MRAIVVVLLLLAVGPAEGARRRNVSPGSPSFCSLGVIAEDGFVAALTIDATTVYYLDDFDLALYAVPKTGGPRRQIATVEDGVTLDLAVDQTHVYYAMVTDFASPIRAGIYSVPKSGGTPTQIAFSVLAPFDIDVDATHVYWASIGSLDLDSEDIMSDGSIERVMKNGSGREVLARALSAPIALALDGSQILYGETGIAVGNASAGVRRVAKTGGAATKLTDGVGVGSIAVAGEEIIFMGGDPEAGPSLIYSIPRNGGSRRELASEEFLWGNVYASGGRIYYGTGTDEDDLIVSIPLGGGTRTIVAADLISSDDFEVDECAVTFASYEAVFRVPR